MNWKLIEDKSWCSLEQQFEWVREMNTVQQDIRYHAEGSVAEHTRMVLEALQQSSAYHSLSTLEKELIWTSAGFRSMDRRYLCREKSRMCALADSTSGPDTPKCVKSISPRSE